MSGLDGRAAAALGGARGWLRSPVAVASLLVVVGVLVAILPGGTALADGPSCGTSTGLPVGATAESTWSDLQTAVGAVTNGDSQTFYLTAALSSPSGQRLSIASGASVALDLDGCDLTITSPSASDAAIAVPASSSLTVEDTSSSTLADQGTLTVTGGSGDYYYSFGISGFVYNGAGAGIGGDGSPYAGTGGGNGGSVTIDGGTVVASGGGDTGSGGEFEGSGAGIGGGGGAWQGSGGALTGTVTINGGSVTATGGATNPSEYWGGAGSGIGGGGSGADQGGGWVISGGALSGGVAITGGETDAVGGTSTWDGGGGAGIGAGGGGMNVALADNGGAGGTMSGSLTVTGGILTAAGGASDGAGGGGAAIGGGGTGDGPLSTGAALTGSVDIQAGSVEATGGASSYAGAGAAVGGGGSELSVGGDGGSVTISGGSLGATAATNGLGIGAGVGYSGSPGAAGSVTVAASSDAAPQVTGEVDGGLTIDQGGELSVPASDTLALDGVNTNDGTIDLGGALTGAGSLANAGSITVSGSVWSADDEGPGATAGASITGNAFDLTFTVPSGPAPSDIWVFAPTVATSGETLPAITPHSGYGASWNSGSAAVGGSTALSPLATAGQISLAETYAPEPAAISAPSAGTYGGSGLISAVGGGAAVDVTLRVDASSSAVCSLSSIGAGTTSTATVNYTGVGACVIDATQDGAYGTATTQQTTIAIGRAPLTITASSATVGYGSAAPPITPTYSGFVKSDTASALSTAPTCSAPVTTTTPIGTYQSSCSGAADANYAITYTTGTVGVVKTTSTTSLSAADKSLTTKQKTRLTVTVAVPGDVPASGLVKVYDGSKVLETVSLSDGKASISVGPFKSGTHKFHVVYQGDATITGSSSSTANVKVKTKRK